MCNIAQNNKLDSLKLVVVIILVPRVLPLYEGLNGVVAFTVIG